MHGGSSILGTSAAITAIRDYLAKVARSSAPVLVTGATGTGKERVARAVHEQSSRCAAPFVALNCAAIPDGLIESELFGWERGAFTGAVQAGRGKALSAHGGTLFLDEIGEMTLLAQSKLLRLLETREVTPLGSGQTRRVDFRVVAATNQQLESLVSAGRFREDLFYRLNVARFTLPPLRERPEDIQVYVNAFIDEFNRERGEAVGQPCASLADSMLSYAWPGNVRELRNFVEGVFIDPPRGTIGFEHLPPAFRLIFGSSREHGLREREALQEALRRTNWNKAEAARVLNWSRMTLYRKLTKHGLDDGSGEDTL